MKVNLFMDYHDCNPKVSSLEEIVRIIREDGSVKERTEKHRYFRAQGLKKMADSMKHSLLCFSVATWFEGGKTAKHIAGWPHIGMADFDKLDAAQVRRLAQWAQKDHHTLMTYTTISGCGLRILFRYGTEFPQTLDDATEKLLYEAAFRRANRHYAALLGVKPDPKCKTCTQLSGVAHDPEVFFRPEADPFVLEVDTVLKEHKQHKERQRRLARATKAAERQLAEEGIVFEPGNHNAYVMRMGYLLNGYGVDETDAADWADEKYSSDYDADIRGIIAACYKHTDEHGKRKLPGSGSGAGGKGSGSGTSYASVDDIELFLNSQVELRFNVIRRQCEIAWKESGEFVPLTDRDENSLWCRMKKDGAEVRLQDIRNVLQSEFVLPYHPFRDYFESLPPWDGVTDHIGQLARTVHVKGDGERFVEHFRKWFVGIIATLFDEQVVNHQIMVFIGRQGNFKSSFFALLLPPPLRSYFHVKMNNSHLTKDDMLTLCEFALVCLEEIDELRPSELNQLKAMVTAKNISERAAYARNKEHRPHIASFCGTENNPHFLSDPTDNRRWIVAEVEDIDDPYLHPFHYDGIYSQAYALWKGGYRYWLDQAEIRELNLQNKEFEVVSPEEQLLLTYFRRPFEGCQGSVFMKVSEILERINGGVKQPLSATRLGMLLKKLGFPKRKFNNERGYLVVERSTEEIKASRKLAAQKLELSEN